MGGAKSSGGGAEVRMAALPRARWWPAMVAFKPVPGRVWWSSTAGVVASVELRVSPLRCASVEMTDVLGYQYLL